MRHASALLTTATLFTLALASTAGAAVLDESFDPSTFDTAFTAGELDPTSRTGSQPSWYRYTLNDATHYVSDSAGELIVGEADDTTGGTNVTFNAVTLANAGDAVTLTFDAYRSSGTAENGFDFRFALLNTSGSITGHGSFPSNVDGIRVDSGIGTQTASRYGVIDNGDDLDGNPNDNGAGFTGSWGSALTDDVQTFALSITRNASDGLDLEVSIDGNPIAASAVTLAAGDVPTYTFDNFSALVKQDVGFNLDNVTVDFVPEPASLALLGLGSLLIVGRRPRA